ncbi:hypothetical protein FOA52_002748 [Chlamydomonas sp. UWO 241]|nr:hypothetical protein FOA52_002748 [Chlamydomonas sp. UWO 241]
MGVLDLGADGAEEEVAARLSALSCSEARVTAAGLADLVDALRTALARGPATAEAAGRPFLLVLRLLRNSAGMAPSVAGPALVAARLHELLPALVTRILTGAGTCVLAVRGHVVSSSGDGRGSGSGGAAATASPASAPAPDSAPTAAAPSTAGHDAGGSVGGSVLVSAPAAAAAPTAAEADLAAAVAQLLANWASGREGAAAVWAACFPATLHQLATFPAHKVAEPATAALYQCCRGDAQRSAALCASPGGAAMLATLLREARSGGSCREGAGGSVSGPKSGRTQLAGQGGGGADDARPSNEWLPLLLSCVSVRQGLLRPMLQCLPVGSSSSSSSNSCSGGQRSQAGAAIGRGDGVGDGDGGFVWCAEMPVALHLLAHELEVMKDMSCVGLPRGRDGAAAPGGSGDGGDGGGGDGGGAGGGRPPPVWHASLDYLLEVVEAAARHVEAAAERAPEPPAAPGGSGAGAVPSPCATPAPTRPAAGAADATPADSPQPSCSSAAAAAAGAGAPPASATPTGREADAATSPPAQPSSSAAAAAPAATAAPPASATPTGREAGAATSPPAQPSCSSAAPVAAAAAPGTAPGGSAAHALVARHVLEAALEAFKKLLSRSDQGESLLGADPCGRLCESTTREAGGGGGLVALCTAMLHALEPVAAQRNKAKAAAASAAAATAAAASTAAAAATAALAAATAVAAAAAAFAAAEDDASVMSGGSASERHGDDAEASSTGAAAAAAAAPEQPPPAQAPASFPVSPAVARLSAGLPRRQPYVGYRGDVLCVLSNALHGRAAVAAQLVECGGVELVLSQCALDDDSPLAREYALWAVRNMCAVSAAARAAIEGLEVVGSVDTPELRRMGMRLELDKGTGKMAVVRTGDDDSLHAPGSRVAAVADDDGR